MKNGYPFPALLPEVLLSNCYYIEPAKNNFEELYSDYQKKISVDTTLIKLQYFSIEQELINSFQFVNPNSENLKTTSVKFATIIREAANIYEQISKAIYNNLFGEISGLNIYNYLSLEKFLKLSDFRFFCPSLENLLKSNSNLLQPFLNISGWDKTSPLSQDNVPTWWTAYNKIKHSPNSIPVFATFENAIQSLAAAFVIVTLYRGGGVLSGDLIIPEKKESEIWHTMLPIQKSILFMTKQDLMSFTY